jgi:dGTPase
MDDHRSAAAHDADRIVYSEAFRRLAGVTQVVAVGERALFHNRLTHTMKVAQLARRLGENLLADPESQPLLAEQCPGFDASTAEAAALAHDLGHPPFGHIAEEALCKLCDEAGLDGYEGNAQSFRIVTKLATRNGSERGLDLQPTTLNAILKYPWLRTGDADDKKFKKYGAYLTERAAFDIAREVALLDGQSLEAQIMDLCDDIAYALHDVEDFFRVGAIPLHEFVTPGGAHDYFVAIAAEKLNRDHDMDAAAAAEVFREIRLLLPGEAYSGTTDDLKRLNRFTSYFITRFLNSVSLSEREGSLSLNVGAHARQEILVLKQMTREFVISRPALASIQAGQVKLINALFMAVLEWIEREAPTVPQRLPPTLRDNLEASAKEAGLPSTTSDSSVVARVAADFIASLTEHQAVDLHRRLCLGAVDGVVADWLRY